MDLSELIDQGVVDALLEHITDKKTQSRVEGYVGKVCAKVILALKKAWSRLYNRDGILDLTKHAISFPGEPPSLICTCLLARVRANLQTKFPGLTAVDAVFEKDHYGWRFVWENSEVSL